MRLPSAKFYEEFVTGPPVTPVSQVAVARLLDGRTDKQKAAEALERLVCEGRSAEILSGAAAARPLAPEVAFAVGRAAEDEESFAIARGLFERAEGATTRGVPERASAHLAYLAYFDGDFEKGLHRASSLASAPDLLARAEAALYRSVNAMALNRSGEALDAALTATRMTHRISAPWLRTDLRFRSSRQLVHVLVARGAYGEAMAEADRAAAIARRSRSGRHGGVAAYLRGFVLLSRGEKACLAYFADADRQWGGAHHAFGRWLRYVWAIALRDHGDPRAAEIMRLTTPVRLAWEEPLFALAAGRIEPPGAAIRPPDQVPFVNAAAGLVHYVSGDPGGARAALASALQEFERCELAHYRRGVAMALAALSIGDNEREAAARIEAEMPGLTRDRLRRWPWWCPAVANRLARFCLERGIAVNYWKGLSEDARTKEDVDHTLRGRDLTEREIEVVRTWAANPDLARADLARTLGVSEATVRNLLNRARRKLGISAPRGSGALRTRLEQLTRASLPR